MNAGLSASRDVIGPGPGQAGPSPLLGLDLSPSHRADVAHVRVGSFDGPLAVLLALIEARELDVLSVPLGDLAEAFIDALARLEGDRIGTLSGFVAVAAQLILIKSRALLPGPPPPRSGEAGDEIDPEEELRRRLLVYRAFRDAGAALAVAMADALGGLFHREAAIAISSAGAAARTVVPAAPAEPLDVRILADAVAALGRVALPPEPPPGRLGRTISVEERAAVIREALREAPVVVLQELLRGVRDRVVAAVTFMAMLELVKRREIGVEQAEPWGPILCRRLA